MNMKQPASRAILVGRSTIGPREFVVLELRGTVPGPMFLSCDDALRLAATLIAFAEPKSLQGAGAL